MWRRSPDRTLLAGVVNDRLLIQSKVKKKRERWRGTRDRKEGVEEIESFFMLPFIRDEMWWTPEHKGRCEGTDRKEGATSRSFLYPRLHSSALCSILLPLSRIFLSLVLTSTLFFLII